MLFKRVTYVKNLTCSPWTAPLNIKESDPSKETSFTVVVSAKTVVLTFFIQMQSSNFRSFGVSKLKFVFLWPTVLTVVLALGWFLNR